MMEKTIAKRVRERLPEYYPDRGYVLQDIDKIHKKPGSSVYRVRVSDKAGRSRDLYAKEHPKGFSRNIHEMMGLVASHELFLIPRILDYKHDFVLSEGAPGETLTRVLFKSVLSWDKRDLIESSRKIGQAIGALQNMTTRGSHRAGDVPLYLLEEIETEDYFKTILKRELWRDVRAQAEGLKSLKTRVAQYHGDPSPHNILMKGGQISLIDYSFQDNATFVDPALYLVSLELAGYRLGLPMRETISRMDATFKRAYSRMTKENYDRPIWSIVKTLTYLHFLLMYATRGRTVKNALVGAVDRRYLLKRVKEGLK